jgi:hypothetical protein
LLSMSLVVPALDATNPNNRDRPSFAHCRNDATSGSMTT